MSHTNNISAAIDPAARNAVLDAIELIRQKLQPVLGINLTPAERQEMPKMGDKTLAFVEKALLYAEQNPSLVPGYLDLAEAQRDLALSATLSEIVKQLSTLHLALEDALMTAGSEAFQSALVFHNSVKGASRSNAGGSQAIYADLAQRFPGRSPRAAGNATA